MSLNKVYSVPSYDMPVYRIDNKRKHKKEIPTQDEFAWSHKDRYLKERTAYITNKINELNKERQELLTELKKRQTLRNQGRMREVKLYAIKLEDDCWYIGMSYNPNDRFLKHCNGKGAQWTKLHPPIKIVETRGTGKYIQDEAADLENDMTLEYALKYGSAYVRGGGFCQAKPKWPTLIKDNEALVF